MVLVLSRPVSSNLYFLKKKKSRQEKKCARVLAQTADVLASIKSVGVWAPSLYTNRPPSWGVFSLMTFTVI